MLIAISDDFSWHEHSQGYGSPRNKEFGWFLQRLEVEVEFSNWYKSERQRLLAESFAQTVEEVACSSGAIVNPSPPSEDLKDERGKASVGINDCVLVTCLHTDTP